jgi:imidazolonepropionase-like amidohydrolase
MNRFRLFSCCLIVCAAAPIAVRSQSRPASGAVVYEGARLITGDASAPIDSGAFVVQNGLITAIGRKGAITVPSGATRVDLTGKTVMPALVNAHSHLGWELFTQYGDVPAAPDNFTPENLLDHLQRHAFYGVGTVNDAGSAVIPVALQFMADAAAGKYPNAARMELMAGVVAPYGGPDGILIRGTRPRKASYEVLRAPDARKAVQDIAAKKIHQLKIWETDRNGSYPAMPPQVYEAVIDEAHKHGILVHAHATSWREQKDSLKAGVDVLVHGVSNEKIDDEMVALLKAKKPYWAPVMGLGSPSGMCDNDPFVDQTMPAKVIADVRASNTCNPTAGRGGGPGGGRGGGRGGTPMTPEQRAELQKGNYMAMIANGARLVLSTDTGVFPRYAFGWADHFEMALYVRLGSTPAEAIIASTSRSAEVLGLKDVGVLSTGKKADFLVLNANPLDDIKNTRQISAVYLKGAKLDRDALLAQWKKAAGTPTSQP